MPTIKKLLKAAPRMRNTLPQNVTRGNGVRNPQKAEAYVGKGVLKNGDTISSIKGSISPVAGEEIAFFCIVVTCSRNDFYLLL